MTKADHCSVRPYPGNVGGLMQCVVVVGWLGRRGGIYSQGILKSTMARRIVMRSEVDAVSLVARKVVQLPD